MIVVGMFAVYNVYNIGPRTLPCGFVIFLYVSGLASRILT